MPSTLAWTLNLVSKLSFLIHGISRLFLLTAFLSIVCCKQDADNTGKFISGEIPQEVYVWQRVWTDPVRDAVKTRAGEFKNTIFLAAEISYDSDTWSCQAFQAPLEHTQENPTNVGLAFRIQANAAKSKWQLSASQKVSEYIKELANHIDSIQIDYDCPSKKLADYSKLLKQLRKNFPNKRLEITCLPDWLNYPEFKDLIQHTDRYIMQVHGVSGHGKGRALCNTTQAYEVAQKCAKLGKPYLMALPTYRHAVSYDKHGKVTSVASEGHYSTSSYEVVSADPENISQLIRTWQDNRPSLMQGIIWYRLPVDTDRMNWTWHTLQKVRKGETIDTPQLEFTSSLTVEGLHKVSLSNNTQQHIDWPVTINLHWQSFCIVHQLNDDYSFSNIQRSKGATLEWKKQSPYPIAPGDTIDIGVFRFNDSKPSLKVTTP